jgi:hypothetical protein
MTFLRCTALLAALCASPAAANEIFASQPKTLVTQLQSLGYRAVIGTDSSGNPKIDSGINGINYTIWFYGCEAGVDCRSIELQSSFTVETPVTMESMNAWNRDNLFGTGFIADDGSAMISYTVSMDGGLTVENFNSVIERWETATDQFTTHIGF